MKKQQNEVKEKAGTTPENELEVIRQIIKKQELQTAILKKLIEKNKKNLNQ